MRYRDPQCRDRLAAEYVLGTLHGGARRRFERLLASDPDLAREVAAWEARLQPLADSLPGIAPPRRVWQNIRRAVDGGGSGLWNSLPFWRTLSLAASVAVLALGLMLALPRADSSHQYVVVIGQQPSDPIWLVAAEPGMRRVTVKTMQSSGMPPDQSCVLWLEWNDGFMQSLGTLPETAGRFTMPMPAMNRRPENARVVVTVEPADRRAPMPSGKVIYKGSWLTL